MGSYPLTLVILYSDLTTFKVPCLDRKAAELFVQMEGDHVIEWYIEEDIQNEKHTRGR